MAKMMTKSQIAGHLAHKFEITKKKLPQGELMHFSRQLSAFVRAGIPLIDLPAICVGWPDRPSTTFSNTFFFRPNDVGSVASVTYKEDVPAQVVRSYSVSLNAHIRQNFDGFNLIRQLTASGGLLWANYWSLEASFDNDFGLYDDRETRGLGLYGKPASHNVGLSVSTDGRNDVAAEVGDSLIHSSGLSGAANADQIASAFLSDQFNRQDSRGAFGRGDLFQVSDQIKLLQARLQRLKLRLGPRVFRQSFPHRLHRDVQTRNALDIRIQKRFVFDRIRQIQHQLHVIQRGFGLASGEFGAGSELQAEARGFDHP